jgi:hypothetical protein
MTLNFKSRAVALHGVHGANLDRNVVYDTMGHAIFVEDAIETKVPKNLLPLNRHGHLNQHTCISQNVVSYNLVVLTKTAPSLLQTDQIPAAFWITNPGWFSFVYP